MRPHVRRRLWLGAASALALVPFALPQDLVPVVPPEAEWAVHAAAFALGAFAWAVAVPRAWPVVLAAGLALGGAVEGLQACCIEGRASEWTDLVADALGLALGLAAAWALVRWRRARSPSATRRRTDRQRAAI